MTAARHQDYGSAGIEAAINRVHFDRGVVNVDDAVDSPRHGLTHVVLLGFADTIHFEERRAGRIKNHHDAARQDGLRSIGSVIRRPRLGHSEGGGKRNERRARSVLCTAGGNRQHWQEQRG